MPEAGHLAMPGPALPASGLGLPTATGTRGGLWRPALTAFASGLDPRCLPHNFPPPSSPGTYCDKCKSPINVKVRQRIFYFFYFTLLDWKDY
jgi:hypothetical protein